MNFIIYFIITINLNHNVILIIFLAKNHKTLKYHIEEYKVKYFNISPFKNISI